MPEAGRLEEAGRPHQPICIQQASIVPNSIAEGGLFPERKCEVRVFWPLFGGRGLFVGRPSSKVAFLSRDAFTIARRSNSSQAIGGRGAGTVVDHIVEIDKEPVLTGAADQVVRRAIGVNRVLVESGIFDFF